MFWRLLLQLLRAGRGRLLVALLAVAGGAAVTSALLNIHLDAETKLTREFRTLGANIVISPPRFAGASDAAPALMDSAALEKLAAAPGSRGSAPVTAAAPYLYVVARTPGDQPVILAGTWMDQVQRMSSWWKVTGEWVASRDDLERCMIGRGVAKQLGASAGEELVLTHAGRSARLRVAGVITSGGAEENQVFVNLPVAQELAGSPGKIALVQLSAAGTPAGIQVLTGELARAMPGLEVRPIRQLAEAEGKLLARIRVLILATVTLILALTTLCVLATMTALAMEHRRDVGLMKAIGGSMARVVRLFLAEVGVIGLVGGAIGWAAGLALSAWIGRSVFGAAISPRFEILPLTLALMTSVAMIGALPLRLLSHVRPAVILRGE